jgi:hypothetical protein
MPPSFSDVEYWDKRFRTNTKAFDWLCPESCFDEELAALARSGYSMQVLHIGSGTSMISFHLSRTLPPSSRIRNLDFSIEAVEWGRNRETESRTTSNNGFPLQAPLEWTQASCLSLESLLATTVPRSVDVIVDKSTSDAIACGPDIAVQPLLTRKQEHAQKSSLLGLRLHPLYILAFNLAVLAKPGARWLCLSYSNDRFPFYSDLTSSSPSSVPEGVLDPTRYWRLLQKKDIQVEEQVDGESKKHAGCAVHRPATNHWMYVLERTVMELDQAVVLGLGISELM